MVLVCLGIYQNLKPDFKRNGKIWKYFCRGVTIDSITIDFYDKNKN